MTHHCSGCRCDSALVGPPAPSPGITLTLDNAAIASAQRHYTLIYNRRGDQPVRKLDPANCTHPVLAIVLGRCVLCDTEGLAG